MENLVIGTYNMSVAAVKHHPEQVVKDLGTLIGKCHAVTLQEAGEGWDLINRAARLYNFTIYRGEDKYGQGATPVIVRNSLGIKESHSFFLTPKTEVGEPGAGGDFMKPKYLNIVRFSFNGRRIWLGSLHTTPSVYIKVRKALTAKQISVAAASLNALWGVKFVGGDLNTTTDSALRLPLEKVAGLTSSQKTLGPLSTEGHRSIDDIYFPNGSKVTIVNHQTLVLSSDHKAYIVEYKVTPTPLWRLRHRK